MLEPMNKNKFKRLAGIALFYLLFLLALMWGYNEYSTHGIVMVFVFANISIVMAALVTFILYLIVEAFFK